MASTNQDDYDDPNQIPVDTTDRDSKGSRKLVMIRAYAEGVGHIKNENTMRCINSAVRGSILPKMKFVPTGCGFGSFDKPDFTDDKAWVNILYSKIPCIQGLTDNVKCKIWIAYRKKVKEQFSLHRSAVTLKIQRAFIKGEKYVLFNLLSSINAHFTKYMHRLTYM